MPERILAQDLIELFCFARSQGAGEEDEEYSNAGLMINGEGSLEVEDRHCLNII